MGIHIDPADINPKDRCGVKKIPLGLCSPRARIEWAKVMAQGAEDYGEYNWRIKKVRLSIYLDAIDRHCMAMQDGEMIDPKSQCSHAGHVMACGSIIIDAEACGALVDDRFIHNGAAIREMARMAGAQNYDEERAKARANRTPCPTFAEQSEPLMVIVGNGEGDLRAERDFVDKETAKKARQVFFADTARVRKHWRKAGGGRLSDSECIGIIDYEAGRRRRAPKNTGMKSNARKGKSSVQRSK